MMEPALKPAFRLRGVTKAFGRRWRLTVPRFDVARGDVFGLVGHNGAGKSTLMRLMALLLAPDGGEIEVLSQAAQVRSGGRETPAQVRLRRRLAMVPQRPYLFGADVRDNVAYPLRVRGARRRDARARADEMLDAFGLDHLAAERARVLSGGEAQRVALARALITEPEVLLLDEPTANIDPASTAVIESVIGRANAGGTTVILATHNLAQARRLCRNIACLHDGEVVETQPVDRFFARPKDPRTQAFLRKEVITVGVS